MTAPTATKPETAGVDPERLEALFARARKDVDDGIVSGCQVAIARNGQLAGSRAFGTAKSGDREFPVDENTLYCLFSSTKAIVSAAVWTLFDEGLLDINEKVADIIPEFATNGKDVVSVEQAFLHIGGFPQAPLGPPKWETKEGRLEAFQRWRLTFEPGSKFEYHASSLHWVLVEIIERRTGIEWHRFLRERIIEPMGLTGSLYIGLPESENARSADAYYAMPPTPPPGGWAEVTPDAILRFNRPEVRAVGIPGGGGMGTAAALAMFYQPLVNGGITADGKRILKAETIEFATTPRTKDHHVDMIFGKPINRALGVMVAGDRENMEYRGFGREASERAFGHGGAGGQIGWGDPETGISVGYTVSGFVDDVTLRSRGVALSTLAGLCGK